MNMRLYGQMVLGACIALTMPCHASGSSGHFSIFALTVTISAVTVLALTDGSTSPLKRGSTNLINLPTCYLT